ncbi:hypothetical protein LAZ67_3004161 [Cordylochernes scorpioides]|uniref:Uncharacterized protein n=1 Tax=Cordylochernes scorpioides TaxID=51811 RepID=A0ABY6K946_9ARAC|nr:hypothetical protein LAZ67_3004161 [Cordylochernes scorpioides]
MEAPLKDCTTLEQREVIRFLNAEGIQTSKICQRIKNIYVQKWTNYMFLRSQRSTGKVLLTIFWDVDGPICLDFLSSRQRMNSDLYCAILVNKLKPDLAPSDYFLFGLLKKELKGKRFDSDEDVQKVVQDFFTRFLRLPIKRVFTSCQNDGDDAGLPRDSVRIVSSDIEECLPLSRLFETESIASADQFLVFLAIFGGFIVLRLCHVIRPIRRKFYH